MKDYYRAFLFSVCDDEKNSGRFLNNYYKSYWINKKNFYFNPGFKDFEHSQNCRFAGLKDTFVHKENRLI